MPTAYNLKKADLATGVHVADREKEASAGTAAAVTDTGNVPAAGGLVYAFTTLANVPNNADWPNGTYKCLIKCTTIHADITFGLMTLEAGVGHFARVNSGLTADQETTVQAEAAFSGTGTKTATVSWNPAAGAAGDRYEGLIAGGNANAKAQDMIIEVDAGASYLEFPDAGSGALVLQSVAGVASVSNVVVGTPRVTLQSVVGVASLANVEVATPGNLSLGAVGGIGSLPNLNVSSPGNLVLGAVAGVASLPNVNVAAPAPLSLGAIAGVASLTNVEVGTPRLNLGAVAGVASLANIEIGTPRLNLDPVAGVATLPNVTVGATFSAMTLQAVAGVASLANVEVATPGNLSLQAVGGIASVANLSITTPASSGGDRGLLLEMAG